MTDWHRAYWRFRNAILTFGIGSPLSRLGTFISPVLIAGLVVFGLSVVFLFTATFGPCGPNSTFGWVCFFSVLVGLAVICVGIILSAVKTIKYFWSRSRHKD